MKSNECFYCKGSGIFIAELDFTKNVVIQRCDHCKKLNSDKDAVKAVKVMVYHEI